MSVAGGGEAVSALDVKKLRMYGIAGGLIGIYAAVILNGALDTVWFSFLAALGTIPAVVLGANSVRRVCSYGIGTGVPSIGMLALGMGVVAAMFGMAIGGVAGPILTTAIAMGFGYLIGFIANKVIKFNIPVMEEGAMDLAGAGALVITGLTVSLVGNLDFGATLAAVVDTGFIAVIFIAGGLALLHPFNACLGPDETQDRTMMLAVSDASLAIVAAGICAVGTLGMVGVLTLLIGFVLWLWSYLKYFELVKRDAAGVVGTGLLPPAVQ